MKTLYCIWCGMPLPECVKVKYHHVGKVKVIGFDCPLCGYGGEFYPTDGMTPDGE